MAKKINLSSESSAAQKEYEAAKDRLQEAESKKPGAYKPSKDVNVANKNTQSAADKLNQIENSKPGAYESKYSTQIDELLNSILNREDFSYDMNADPLYNQYKDQYVREGNNAMRDTIGQTSALTGGYGSSYAGIAGSQAYDSYLQKLNDRVPELYQLAYQKYQDEGSGLYNQLGAVQGLEQDAYGKYRDTVSDWQGDRNYYAGRYDSALNQSNYMSERDYQRYQDIMNQYNTDREYYAGRVDSKQNNYHGWLNLDKDYYAMDQEMKQFNAQLEQDMKQFNAQMAQDNNQFYAQLNASKSRSGGSSSGSSNSKQSTSSKKTSASSTKKDLQAYINTAKSINSNPIEKMSGRSAISYIQSLPLSQSEKREIALMSGLGPINI